MNQIVHVYSINIHFDLYFQAFATSIFPYIKHPVRLKVSKILTLIGCLLSYVTNLESEFLETLLVGVLRYIIIGAELEREVSTMIGGNVHNDRDPGPSCISSHNSSGGISAYRCYKFRSKSSK